MEIFVAHKCSFLYNKTAKVIKKEVYMPICIENMLVPPTKLFEKQILKQDLSASETIQAHEFALLLTYLQDYGSANDKEKVEYIAQFFSYFCNQYDSYYSLPEEVKLSFDVAYFSGPETFMYAAHAASSCTDNFGEQ
jgi:hypothetical protein